MADRQVYINENSLTDIADSIRAKNGTQNTYVPAQMAAAIDDIDTLVGQTKTVTPTTSQQTITPDQNYNALTSVTVNAIETVNWSLTPYDTAKSYTRPTGKFVNKVTVKAVTSDIDPDIVPHNIASGINILGTTGTLAYTDGSEVNF